MDPLIVEALHCVLYIQTPKRGRKRGLNTAFTIVVNALNSMSVTRLSLPISEVIHVEIVKVGTAPIPLFHES